MRGANVTQILYRQQKSYKLYKATASHRVLSSLNRNTVFSYFIARLQFIMDVSVLNQIMGEIYMPSKQSKPTKAIPQHHPSLIMQDYQTDTTHHQSCGCCGNMGNCITDAWWYQDSSRKNTRPALSARSSYSSTHSNNS